MKIFFAGSIRGGRQLIPTYQYIIRCLKSRNYTVISEHVAAEGLEKAEAKMTEQEIYEKDANWIEESDCVVAEITVPSIGVGSYVYVQHILKTRISLVRSFTPMSTDGTNPYMDESIDIDFRKTIFSASPK